MEFEHFSHHHGLIFHQMPPQASEIHCSGCKFPGSGRVYVCWQFSYFLHEQCFLATRSLKHPSHPLHTLTLMPSPTFPSASFSCDSCSLVGKGFSYSCCQCEFDMHVHCALRRPPSNADPHASATGPNFSISKDAHISPQNLIYRPTQNNTFPLSNTTLPNQTHITAYPPSNPAHSFPQPDPLPRPNYHPPMRPSPTTQITPIGYPQSNNPSPNYPPSNTMLPSETHITTFPPNSLPQIPPTPPPPNYSPPVGVPTATIQTCSTEVSSTTVNLPSQPTATIITYSNNVSSTIVNPPPPSASSIGYPLSNNPIPNYPPSSETHMNTFPPNTMNPPSPATRYPQSNNPQPTVIKHFSHPHFLKAIELGGESKKNCSACDRALSGSAYCCTKSYCTFKIHKLCFDSPLEVCHKSHLQHPLKLITAPPYEDEFTCDACLKNGKAFAYNCTICSYDLHIDCISWPETMSRPDHEHDVILYYSYPLVEKVRFMCDVCRDPMHKTAWMYYCHDCDFGTHLECVTCEIKQLQGEEEEEEEEMDNSETDLESLVLKMAIQAQSQKAALALWD